MTRPQLITMDSIGEHSKDIKATRDKAVKKGAWRKQRVITLLPSADMISAKVALSHWSLIFPPNNGVHRMLALGQEVGFAYSNAIEQILAHPDLSQWEFILTLESDNIPPPDGLIRLIEFLEEHQEFSACSGLYFCKGPGGVNAAHVWGDIRDPVLNFRPMPPPMPGEYLECCGLSNGFSLFRLSMFKDERIKRPWFRTLNGKEGNGVGTQDLSLWTEARKAGHRCAVIGDVRVGHYDMTGQFGFPDTVW